MPASRPTSRCSTWRSTACSVAGLRGRRRSTSATRASCAACWPACRSTPRGSTRCTPRWRPRTPPSSRARGAGFPARRGDGLLALLRLYGDVEVLDAARARAAGAAGDRRGARRPEPARRAMRAEAHPQVRVGFDLADLGGYAYYSGARFAIYARGASDAIARGGRYDEVGAVFGRNRPAVGFSLDVKELAAARAAGARPRRDPRALGRGRGAARRGAATCASRARSWSACCRATSTRARNSTATASWSPSTAAGRCARSEQRVPRVARRSSNAACSEQSSSERRRPQRRRRRHPVGRRRQGQGRRLADRPRRRAWCASRAATTPATRWSSSGVKTALQLIPSGIMRDGVRLLHRQRRGRRSGAPARRDRAARGDRRRSALAPVHQRVVPADPAVPRRGRQGARGAARDQRRRQDRHHRQGHRPGLRGQGRAARAARAGPEASGALREASCASCSSCTTSRSAATCTRDGARVRADLRDGDEGRPRRSGR